MARKQRQLDIDDALLAAKQRERMTFDEYCRELRAQLRSIDAVALEMSPRQWELVRELLMAVGIHAYHDRHRRCQQPAESLLATAQRGTPLLRTTAHLYQARRDAVALGLLGTMRGGADAHGDRLPDVLWLETTRLDELVDASREQSNQQSPGPGTGRLSNQPKLARTSPNQPKPARTTYRKLSEPTVRSVFPQNQSSFSLPSRSSARTADTAGSAGARSPLADWSEVEEEVFSCGINDRGVVAAARSRGASAAEVRALVAWWQPRRGAWDHPEAVLWRRLRRFDRGLPVDQGWDRARGGWVDEARVAARQALHVARCAADDAARAAADAERRRLATLKAELGPELEQLGDDELQQLMREAAAGDAELLAYYRKRGKASPVVQTDLLLALEKRRAGV